MPNDRLANTLRLRPRSAKPLQLLQRHETPMPLERHVRIATVLLRSGNIVVQTSQRPGFEKVFVGSRRRGDPVGEVLGDKRVAVAVDAQAVVVGLGREDFFDVLLGSLNELGLRPDGGKVYGNGGCFGFCC